MKISIITLFPEMFEGPLNTSILKHAQTKNQLSIEYINIRDFGIGRHKMVDDTPYGGGVGMLMRVDVVHQAILSTIDASLAPEKRKIIITSAHGQQFNQQKADSYSKLEHLIIVCGHYEGIDSRITHFIDEEISVGDFVTTGGEIPAMLITDAVSRRIEGVLKKEATQLESFQTKLTENSPMFLEHEQFTKPVEYLGIHVPDVLLSGHHEKIKLWKQTSSSEQTTKKRPDLIKKG